MSAPLPNPDLPFEQQDPVVLYAMCVWGEARGVATLQGKIAQAFVVSNRVGCNGKYGEGFAGVILKPYQFSCFNANDPNRAKLLEPLKHDSVQTWEACYTAAYMVYKGNVSDPSLGGIFYFSEPLKVAPKAWGNVIFTAQIDGLHFFKPAPRITPGMPVST